MRPWIARLVLALLAAVGHAQEPADGFVRVELTVTRVGEREVELDGGGRAHLAVGDRIQVLPRTGAVLEGVLREVGPAWSRAELFAPAGAVQVGDRVEARVPVDRMHGATEAELPWRAPPEEWSRDLPLLAPVQTRTAADRPTQVHGRLFLQGDLGRDDLAGSEHDLLRMGAGLEASNPFGRGGRLALDLEAYRRSFEDSAGEGETSRLRADRLSWSVGGGRGSPWGLDLGRFPQRGVPELGRLDGIEVERRLDSGHAVGLSLGFVPTWDDELRTGDNAQAAAFYRFQAQDPGTFASTLAFQKTWYRGAPDRDLFVWSADWAPGQATRLYAATWVDLYGDGAESRSSGPELTQAVFSATHRFDAERGLSCTATHLRWPELEAEGLFSATDEEVAETEVTRLGLRGWSGLGAGWRADAGLGVFSDDADSGASADLRLTLDDAILGAGAASLGVEVLEAKETSGLGLRASAARPLGSATVRLDGHWADYEQTVGPGEEALLENALRLGLDLVLGGWDLSVHAERRFGDDADALTAGFYLQRSFGP